jgi:Putative binding domain, N-terminal/Viral BACON domain
LLLASLVVGCASSALAQPVVDPRIAEFNPSPDHSEVVNGVAVVTRYELEISVVGSSAAPVRVLSLGKPNPDTDGIVRVAIDTLLTPPLNVGVTYEARVAAVGPGGRGLSAPSNPFVFDTGTCGYDVTPTSRSVAAGGGSSTFSVATAATCAWTAVSQSSWITVTSGAAASGNGTVGFTVAANPGAARSGTILIAGENVTVTQPAVPTCSYDATPNSRAMPVGGGNSTFSVATTSGCTWSAVSQTSWIAVTSGSSGSGNGTVGFSVAANTGPARSGTILIAGETVSVTQPSGTTCAYTITPTSRSIAVGGGSSTFSVATTSGCAWAALSEAGWITITSGSSWSGNGTVAFTAAANTGPSRTGTINIAGQDVSVTQASGVTCTYNVSPLNPTVAAGGGAVTITVTGQSGCAWTAAESPTVSWVSITSGASGSGNGIVSLSVTANSQRSARTMSLTIGGHTVTLTQSGTAPTLTRPKGLRVVKDKKNQN